MSKLARILWTEPIVVLSAATGVTAVLAEQHLVPGWIPLVVLAAATPIQRSLVIPTRKLVKRMVRRG
jgi:hypothetical protein